MPADASYTAKGLALPDQFMHSDCSWWISACPDAVLCCAVLVLSPLMPLHGLMLHMHVIFCILLPLLLLLLSHHGTMLLMMLLWPGLLYSALLLYLCYLLCMIACQFQTMGLWVRE